VNRAQAAIPKGRVQDERTDSLGLGIRREDEHHSRVAADLVVDPRRVGRHARAGARRPRVGLLTVECKSRGFHEIERQNGRRDKRGPAGERDEHDRSDDGERQGDRAGPLPEAGKLGAQGRQGQQRERIRRVRGVKPLVERPAHQRENR
jgi:hypothetical protein